MMKFLLYSVIFYLIIKLLKSTFNAIGNDSNKNNSSSAYNTKEKNPSTLDQPKFKIEAEDVDFEEIKTKNNEK